MDQRACYIPKESDLLAARKIFQEHEPRDLFYRAASELIGLAIAGQTKISISEALGMLLQTWNKSFYRFHGKFDETHFLALKSAVEQREKKWKQWRDRSIESVRSDEEKDIAGAFTAFETVVGPVGAAKALHLLSPNFFPLWDRAIANGYGVGLRKTGDNARRYLRFIEITKQQVLGLGNSKLRKTGILKLIDEYNYSVITKGWLSRN